MTIGDGFGRTRTFAEADILLFGKLSCDEGKKSRMAMLKGSPVDGAQVRNIHIKRRT